MIAFFWEESFSASLHMAMCVCWLLMKGEKGREIEN